MEDEAFILWIGFPFTAFMTISRSPPCVPTPGIRNGTLLSVASATFFMEPLVAPTTRPQFHSEALDATCSYKHLLPALRSWKSLAPGLDVLPSMYASFPSRTKGLTESQPI